MLNYCIVKQRIGAITEDTPDDDDRYPDYTSVFGQVVFAPTMANGSAYKITDGDGLVHTVPATRITAQIVNGEITHEGLPGLPLFAAGSNANPSTIVYTATYSNLTAAGRPVDLNSITFRAVPGETIDLSSYTPVAGAPTPGIIQGPPGHTPYIGQNGNWWISSEDTGVAATSPLVHSYTELTEAFEENTLRVKSLEAMNGVAPETPVDGQTANLITQSDTLTRAALDATNVDLMTATSDTLPTGDDLITGEGWTLGEGWTGTLTDGFTHTPTGGGALEWALPTLVPSVVYLLTVTVEGYAVNNNFPGDLSMDIAGESLHPIYRGSGNTTQTYQRAFYPKNSDPLSITVKASTPAVVTDVKLVRVLGNIPATATWRDPQGDPSIELRTNGHKSVFLGLDAGRRHQGDNSVGIGAGALMNDVTGFFNVAVGMDALKSSRRVSRNVAIGYQSLAENQGGDRNVAVGPFSGHRISTGNENTLLGVDTLWQSSTGSRNIAVGLYAMGNADSSDQIAIGNSALRYATSGENNIAIGTATMGQASAGTRNVALGRAALNRNTGDANVAVGNLASYFSNGSYNVAVGTEALNGGPSATPSNTVAIGHRAGTSVTTGARNTLVGYSAGRNLTTGNSNTVLGNLSGENLTTGANNIILGHMAGGGLSAGNENIIIGGAARSSNPNASGFINIGNVLYGSRSSGHVGIGVEVPGAVLHLKASSGSPGTAPLRFDAGPLVPTPVSGAVEFDGSKLYITIAGKRQEIALVTPEPTE